MTTLLEYLDLTALLEYIDLLNRYSGGPSWGLLGPLSGWGPGQNAPVAPPCGRPCEQQVSTLIDIAHSTYPYIEYTVYGTHLYCLGEDAEDVLDTPRISAEDKKKYAKVVEAFDAYFKMEKALFSNVHASINVKVNLLNNS